MSIDNPIKRANRPHYEPSNTDVTNELSELRQSFTKTIDEIRNRNAELSELHRELNYVLGFSVMVSGVCIAALIWFLFYF